MSEKVELTPSIVHFHSWPLVLVTCADEQDRPNIIALAASSPCSYTPPTIGIAVAPQRYSYGLIEARGAFGVNLPSRRDLEAADLTGSISGRTWDKFSETGFTAYSGAKLALPLIVECPINFECKVIHTTILGSHTWFIGEIMAAYANAEVVDKGKIAQDRVEGVCCWWGEYFAPGERLGSWNFSAAAWRSQHQSKIEKR